MSTEERDLSPSIQIVPDIVPGFTDVKDLKHVLQGKEIAVTVVGVRHVGEMPDPLVEGYGSYDLRTVEYLQSSCDRFIGPDDPHPETYVENMFYGLGPAPKYPLHHLQKEPAVLLPHEDNYYSKAMDRYNDVRGVDHTIAAVWAELFANRKVREDLSIPNITAEEQEVLSRETIMYTLNNWRDCIQAYCMSKILALYTYDKPRANLMHIGGANHVSLTHFLTDVFGVPATVSYEGAKPSPIRETLRDVMPPRTAVRYIKTMNYDEVTFDHEAMVAQLEPHLPLLLESIRQSEDLQLN